MQRPAARKGYRQGIYDANEGMASCTMDNTRVIVRRGIPLFFVCEVCPSGVETKGGGDGKSSINQDDNDLVCIW